MWVLPVIIGVANVMELITFIQFIEEEAVQTASLGTFLALRSNVLTGAVKGINRVRVINDHLRLINDTFGYIAIYSQGCFSDFCDAVDTNLEIYDDILYARMQQKMG